MKKKKKEKELNWDDLSYKISKFVGGSEKAHWDELLNNVLQLVKQPKIKYPLEECSYEEFECFVEEAKDSLIQQTKILRKMETIIINCRTDRLIQKEGIQQKIIRIINLYKKWK